MVKKDLNIFKDHKDAKEIGPVCIFLPKRGAYRKDFFDKRGWIIRKI